MKISQYKKQGLDHISLGVEKRKVYSWALSSLDSTYLVNYVLDCMSSWHNQLLILSLKFSG